MLLSMSRDLILAKEEMQLMTAKTLNQLKKRRVSRADYSIIKGKNKMNNKESHELLVKFATIRLKATLGLLVVFGILLFIYLKKIGV
jgi:hypothetical protein